ncbi:MAG TPA: cellulase family glycosylhydrolase [Solirubrobacteraceae bacterium]|jgi:endoglycosylceramidase|nr:cellulase family glycosylhydrolase [Solirubrobacteraceae bacterium]
MRAPLAAAVLALALAAAAPTHAATPRLTVERGDRAAIVDDAGRQVLLRGVNVNQLGDYYQADPALPTTIPLAERDFEEIARLGFNVVRLVMSWSAFQPERGAFDEGYVARVREAVRWAARHDLYVVLDMHQDAWGKHVATPPGYRCEPGLAPAVGWDGAPLWATLTDGMTTCRANETRELSPAVAQAFESFYADREGIQSELVATWGRIAAALGGEPNVAGYDLLNEPHPGFRVGVNQGVPLGRYYARAIEAIRAAETGPPRIAFFEPSVLWSGFGNDTTPPPGFTPDGDVVFAPHLYSESISVDQGATSIEQGFDNAERAAAAYGAPLWSGEWGWFGPPEQSRARLERYLAEEDARRLGGAWWVWKQACGDPHVAGYPGASGSLNPTECPSGRPLGLVTGYTDLLRRAYPRFAPGRLTELRSDWRSGRWSLRGRAGDGSCRLEVWVPDGEPDLAADGVGDLRAERRPGGWLVTGCARGAYALSGAPAEASRAPAAAAPCRSRRRIVIHARGRVVRVRTRGVRPRRVTARGRRVVVDLRGSRRGRIVVTIRLRGGRVERRVYRTCRPNPRRSARPAGR